MAPAHYLKPEAALQRAEELVKVEKERDALDVLHECIKARRNKTWNFTQTHEDIIMMHVRLSINLGRALMLKEALFAYKQIVMQINPPSLEKVVLYLLDSAEQKTQEAQQRSIEKVEEIDDLDQGDDPERLLLAVVSNAVQQDRMDQTVLSPWLRFTWDSLRNCLELLRNNIVFEQLYHKIARRTLSFCVRYQRRSEYRKLAELLRSHLYQAQRLHAQATAAAGSKCISPDSIALIQETRLCHLDTAIQMGMWQDAYRAAEDVHASMDLTKDKEKKKINPSSHVNYFDKLSLIFWKAGCALLHAAALLQKFTIYKDMNRRFSEDNCKQQATQVLLAILAVPLDSDVCSIFGRQSDVEDRHVVNIRILANLLRMPMAPTRVLLLREAGRLGIMESADQTVVDLYKILENNFAPNRIAAMANAQLTVIENEFPERAEYVRPLQNVIAIKTLKQMSLIYDAISWSRLQKILYFYDELTLERFFVEAAKKRFIKATVDQRTNTIYFGTAADAASGCGVDLEDATFYDVPEFSQLNVSNFSSSFAKMHNKLRRIVSLIDGGIAEIAKLEHVTRSAQAYLYQKQDDHERIFQRKVLIENSKELRILHNEKHTAQRMAQMQAQEEKRRNEERIRLEEAKKMQDLKRKQNEQEDVQRRIRADNLKKMQQNKIYQEILKKYTDDELCEMDLEVLMREQRNRIDEERMEQQKKLQAQERKFDHQIRAFHIEEKLEWMALSIRKVEIHKKLFAKYQKKFVENKRAHHERAVAIYSMIPNVMNEVSEYISSVKERNADKFEAKMAAFREKLEDVRSERLKDRAAERKQEREKQYQEKLAAEKREQKDAEEARIKREKDEQRRAGQGERPQRRERDDAPSAALADKNWREGKENRPPPSAFSAASGGNQSGYARSYITRPEKEADIRGAKLGVPPLSRPCEDRFRSARDDYIAKSASRYTNVESDKGPWIRGQVVSSHTETKLPTRWREEASLKPETPEPAAPIAAAPASDKYIPIWQRAKAAPVVDADGFTEVHARRKPAPLKPTPAPKPRITSDIKNMSWRQ